MTDLYTCKHDEDIRDCAFCDIEREDTAERIRRRKASIETRWFAVTSRGRFRLEAHHETDAVTKAKRHSGDLKRVIKETRETIWEPS